jgi:hypothetical protein
MKMLLLNNKTPIILENNFYKKYNWRNKMRTLMRMTVEPYQGSYKKNLEILSAGGAVHITTKAGQKYYTCSYPSVVEGYDLVLCNDAPRGGKTGNYIAATKAGDKTYERLEFVKRWRYLHRDKIRKNWNNSDAGLRHWLAISVDIISELPAPKPDQPYYINGYHGCGVYRVAVQNGKIVATLHGGYHNSCPWGVDSFTWKVAVLNYLKEKLDNDFEIVKADGSGCTFFLREPLEDVEVKEYNVPSIYPPYVHHNIEVAG